MQAFFGFFIRGYKFSEYIMAYIFVINAFNIVPTSFRHIIHCINHRSKLDFFAVIITKMVFFFLVVP